MTQIFVTLLRGINVSGQNKIKMTDLKILFQDLQFKDVITYIQSGNVIFKTVGDMDTITMRDRMQSSINNRFGLNVKVILRDANDFQNIRLSNPFIKEKNIDIKRLYVSFLNDIPAPENLKSLNALDITPDR